MSKELTFETDAREAILSGVEKLSRAVVSTLGPKGRNAVLSKSWGGPTVTKDGVTVAREIELRDKRENLGAQLVKQASVKTNDRAGDGTTTSTLLAWRLYEGGLKFLTVGSDPNALIRGMRNATLRAVEAINAHAKRVTTNDDIRSIATIAANNDPEIGRILAEAWEEVGKDGVIVVEEGKSLETEVRIVQGMQFDRGFLSPNFATDTEALETVYEKPLILIYEGKVSNVQELLPLLEKVKEAKRPLLIVAEDVEGEALATLVVNKLRGILDVVAVKAPGYGERRKEMLRDLAVLTGGEAVMKDSGTSLENVTLDMLGTARKVVVDANTTTVIEGAGKKAEVQKRAELIRRQIEETTSDYDREKLEERLARLVGGIARILVGGATEAEAKERKHRFEDAKHATQAAIEEGILPGGGTALARIAVEIAKHGEKLPDDERIGYELTCKALQAPLRQIAENAGEDGSLVLRKVLGERKFAYGWNALTDAYGDLLERGVVDPAKVARTALENAVSVAATLMTTDCLIVEAPKSDDGDAGMDEDDF